MSDLPASIWNMLSPERRGRIATLLGQMALQRMRSSEVAEDAAQHVWTPELWRNLGDDVRKAA